MKQRHPRSLDFLVYRTRYLPGQLARARAKVITLEAEAKRYGFKELLTNPEHVNAAWDDALDEARAAAGTADL